ncbi:ester cyclase [Spirosoma terrae]|uniref:Ester cyclase n=1 Tax=Spirosoma terrae TaxID=1968276 RepID=A0A6L9LF54_9BACT|nr:ester cyclase [Spirosoma terrae]NDU97503.1 ester cyclase [Spirosoma terrae]
MDINQINQVAIRFIEEVWNQQRFDKLDDYLHTAYVDHSLPTVLSPDRLGLVRWIQATSQSFVHRTSVEDQVSEGNKTILKVKMSMTHIGSWRGIDPTGAQVMTEGYRFYRFQDGKIIEHWAEINGSQLESQLKQLGLTGCKMPD